MPNIEISVTNKIATQTNKEIIVCENSGYNAVFTFDDEWASYSTKTARFLTASGTYSEVAFTGTTCAIPRISDSVYICIGVYTGTDSTATALQTTTPAFVQCTKSILSGGGTHVAPTTDVYAQIIALLNGFNASVSKSGSTSTITITDPNGTTTASVSDGSEVSASATGTSTNEVQYLTIDDTEYKLPSGGSGGTSDFEQLENRPKYNGNVMSGSTNIPEVPSNIITKISADDGLVSSTSSGQATVGLSSESQASLALADSAYQKPSGGIPSSDMTSAVQTSLGKADTALQEHQDISGKENTSNKVTSISSASTDSQYPSAKAVYDELNKEFELIETITCDGETMLYNRTATPDGVPYSFSCAKIIFESDETISTSTVFCFINENNNNACDSFDGKNKYCTSMLALFGKQFFGFNVVSNYVSATVTGNILKANGVFGKKQDLFDNISSLIIRSYSNFTSGTTIKIYAIKD